MNYVYKYLKADRKRFLTDGFIRFTQPADLNDPYECLAAFPEKSSDELLNELIENVIRAIGYDNSLGEKEKIEKKQKIAEALDRIGDSRKNNENFVRDFINKINNGRINDGLGILSVSRRWNSALMWSHYTETYKGFCVGFHRENDFFKEIPSVHGPIRSSLLPVNYSNVRTVMPQRREHANGFEIFLTKSLDWRYEKEDRVLAHLAEADKVVNDDNKPYPICLFKVPLEAISEITLGHAASEELRCVALEAGEKLGVAIYRTKISSSSFDVEREPLNEMAMAKCDTRSV